MTPTPLEQQGLTDIPRGSLPSSCSAAALETSAGTVALAVPGRVELFGPGNHVKVVPVPGTGHASAFLPVEGLAGEILVPRAAADGLVGVRRHDERALLGT